MDTCLGAPLRVSSVQQRSQLGMVDGLPGANWFMCCVQTILGDKANPSTIEALIQWKHEM